MDSAVTKGWSLHPQLAQDTVPLGDLPLARVLLAKDANYPWLRTPRCSYSARSPRPRAR
jgi:hypothetical protein